MRVVRSLPSDHACGIDKSLVIKRIQGLGSSTQMLKLSSTSYFKYFVVINSANFARKTNVLMVLDLLADYCICIWNKLIKQRQSLHYLSFLKIIF